MGQFFQFMLLDAPPKVSIERLRSPGKRAERINWERWGSGRQTLAGFGGPWRNRVEIGVGLAARNGRRRFFPTATQGHSAQRFAGAAFHATGRLAQVDSFMATPPNYEGLPASDQPASNDPASQGGRH
nr:hypothetical protein [Sphingobium sp. SJ10-10]